MRTEQLLGRTGPASDLYVLGATAVHALTGVHPADTTINWMRLECRKHLHGSTKGPPQLASILDGLLEPVVEAREVGGAYLKAATRSHVSVPRW